MDTLSIEKDILTESISILEKFFPDVSKYFGLSIATINKKTFSFYDLDGKKGSHTIGNNALATALLDALSHSVSYSICGLLADGLVPSPSFILSLIPIIQNVKKGLEPLKISKDFEAMLKSSFHQEYPDASEFWFSRFFKLSIDDKVAYNIVLFSKTPRSQPDAAFLSDALMHFIDSFILVKALMALPASSAFFSPTIILDAAQKLLTKHCGVQLDTFKLAELCELPYEKKPNEGVLLFSCTPDSKSINLEKPIVLDDLRQIRKLLEVSKHSYGLTVNSQGTVSCLTHLGTEENTAQIRFFGTLGWMLYVNNQPILQFRNGNYLYPRNHKHIDDADKVFNSVLKHCDEGSYNKNAIKNLLEQIKHLAHGAMIVFTNDAPNEARRLCALNRGIMLECLPAENVDLNALSAIDGAILLDLSGCCHAFGVIVDGEAIQEGCTARGARFNSAANYIAWKNGKLKGAQGTNSMQINGNAAYIGIVHSDDGMVDVFPSLSEFLDNE